MKSNHALEAAPPIDAVGRGPHVVSGCAAVTTDDIEGTVVSHGRVTDARQRSERRNFQCPIYSIRGCPDIRAVGGRVPAAHDPQLIVKHRQLMIHPSGKGRRCCHLRPSRAVERRPDIVFVIAIVAAHYPKIRDEHGAAMPRSSAEGCAGRLLGPCDAVRRRPDVAEYATGIAADHPHFFFEDRRLMTAAYRKRKNNATTKSKRPI